ncbi:hypothetical protein GGI35DRAFT_490952 [Trichoderma velutinum]
MKVLIIGGGVGGLCLAHGLLKTGIEVQVFEQQVNNTENLAGYGIHINQDGRRALRTCLPLSNWTRLQTIFTPAGAQLYFRDTQLQLLAERDDAELSGKSIKETERCGIGRLELRDILLEGLIDKRPPVIEWNKVFIRYDRLPDGDVRAHFSDGTFADGDLLVGADGPNSTVRHQYLPDLKRLDLGVCAIAGRYLLDENRIENLPAEITDGSLNNIVPYGKGWMFSSAWKSRPADGNHYSDAEHYVVWAYVLPTEDIPQNAPGLDGSKLRDHVLEVTKGWSPQLRNMLSDSDTSSIKFLSLRSMPTLSKWDPSNVTLLGDAIHNMTPMGGIGANTALQDAEVLSRHITDVAAGRLTVVEAVGNYQDEMLIYANEALKLSRRNAENACNGGGIRRFIFRGLLRAARASPAIMRATIGRTAVKE